MATAKVEETFDTRVQHEGADWRDHRVTVLMTPEQQHMFHHGSPEQKRILIRTLITPLVLEKTGGKQAIVREPVLGMPAGDISDLPIPLLSEGPPLEQHPHCG